MILTTGQFILQADFLLVTNREMIENNKWNQALVGRVPHAFLNAVRHFNHDDAGHSWLPYVPLEPSNENNILSRLPAETINLLSKEAILESGTGVWALPSDLTFVPDDFRADNRAPLIPPGASKAQYLSTKYPDGIQGVLDKLGVATLSEEDFLSDLENFISSDPMTFQSQHCSWHSKVAGILVRMLSRDDEEFRGRIMALSLVPLSDPAAKGSEMKDSAWIAPSQGIIFFPDRSGCGRELPRALNVRQVHHAIHDKSQRWSLLIQLGVEEFSEQAICEAIVATHKDPSFQPQNVQLQDLISHVLFLKRATWKAPKGGVKLWFGTSDGARRLGSAVYVDTPLSEQDELPFSATVLFEKNRSEVHFIHGDYRAALDQSLDENLDQNLDQNLDHNLDENLVQNLDQNQQGDHQKADYWLRWLACNFGLTVIPRLAEATCLTSSDWKMTRDFRHVLDHDPITVLQLLRRWWESYAVWVDTAAKGHHQPRPNDASRENIRKALSSMVVPCRGGGQASLWQTLLPRESVIVAMKALVAEAGPPAPDAAPETGQHSVPEATLEALKALEAPEVLEAPEAPEAPEAVPDVVLNRSPRGSLQFEGSERGSDADTASVSMNNNFAALNLTSPRLPRLPRLPRPVPASNNPIYALFRTIKDFIFGNRRTIATPAWPDDSGSIYSESVDSVLMYSESIETGLLHDSEPRVHLGSGWNTLALGAADDSEQTCRFPGPFSADALGLGGMTRPRPPGPPRSGLFSAIFASVSSSSDGLLVSRRRRGGNVYGEHSPSSHAKWPTGSWAVPETAPPGDSPASPGRPAETRSRASSELLLDVPDPEDSGWDFLASLGVVVSPDLDAFLSRLRQLCHQATTKAQVEAVYHQLERFGAADHVDKIRYV